MWQDQPHERLSAPDGESVDDLEVRVQRFAKKADLRKNKTGSVVVIAAEPVASRFQEHSGEHAEISENWTIEVNSGTWDVVVAGAKATAD